MKKNKSVVDLFVEKYESRRSIRRAQGKVQEIRREELREYSSMLEELLNLVKSKVPEVTEVKVSPDYFHSTRHSVVFYVGSRNQVEVYLDNGGM